MIVVLSFCVSLVLFIIIGALSVIKSRKNSQDYLLAGHSVKPWLVALSAVATNNSGYMFTGMIGFTYLSGLSSIWLMIGWITGDLVGSLLIHKKVRVATEKRNIHTFSGVISNWHGTHFRVLRFLAGAISLIFLGAYAAAQFNAGSKALHVLFGWDIHLGAIIGSIIVLVYCFAGGIRASIWTDAAQSFVMIISMTILFFSAVAMAGGFEASWQKLGAVQEGYLNWFPADHPGGAWGPFLFVLGWFFAGFGVVGQPHIMIRFMTLDNAANMTRMRIYYYFWFFFFYAVTIGVGLMARLIIPHEAQFDAELALPMMSLELLPAVLVGLTLAGLFAATMSTADSLVLSCSAALTRDFFPSKQDHFLFTKFGTVFVTAIALFIALTGYESVFQLVLYSWAVLAAGFGPLLLVYAFHQRPNEPLAVMMLVISVAVVFIWRALGLSAMMYEVAPGILAGLAVFALGKAFGMTLRDEKVESRAASS